MRNLPWISNINNCIMSEFFKEKLRRIVWRLCSCLNLKSCSVFKFGVFSSVTVNRLNGFIVYSCLYLGSSFYLGVWLSVLLGQVICYVTYSLGLRLFIQPNFYATCMTWPHSTEHQTLNTQHRKLDNSLKSFVMRENKTWKPNQGNITKEYIQGINRETEDKVEYTLQLK